MTLNALRYEDRRGGGTSFFDSIADACEYRFSQMCLPSLLRICSSYNIRSWAQSINARESYCAQRRKRTIIDSLLGVKPVR
jgi:hypothetical protein